MGSPMACILLHGSDFYRTENLEGRSPAAVNWRMLHKLDCDPLVRRAKLTQPDEPFRDETLSCCLDAHADFPDATLKAKSEYSKSI